MRGSCYGDFSRLPFDPAKQYRAVLMQQGRVELDSDWNESQAIRDHLLASGLADVLGPGAAPTGDAGYEIRPSLGLAFYGNELAQAVDPFVEHPNPGGTFTIEAWIDWGGVAGNVLGCSRNGPGSYYLEIDGDGMLEFGLAHGVSVGGAVDWTPVVAADPLPKGSFVHVAAVCTGSSVALYVDGARLAQEVLPSAAATGSGLSRSGAGVFEIGASRAGGSAEGFTGVLGGVRVWTIALSTAELAAAGAADRRDAFDLGQRGLAAWWPLDEGVGFEAGELVARNVARFDPSAPPSWTLVDLDIEPGRYYVGGVACTLDEGVRYTRQRTNPGAVLPTAPGHYLAYLEVWERTVNAAEDPSLLEVALGGVDTTVRSQVVGAVRLLPLAAEAELGQPLPVLLEAAGRVTTGRMRAAKTDPGTVGNYLYRIEIARSGDTEAGVRGVSTVPVVAVDAAGILTLGGALPTGLVAGDGIALLGRDAGGAAVEVHGTVSWLGGEGDPRLRVVSDSAALRGLELTHVRTIGASPTFSWSRTNGSVVLPLAPLEQGSRTVTVVHEGLAGLPLQVGDTVQILDDAIVFGEGPQVVRCVTSVDKETSVVELDQPPPLGVGFDPGRHPFLRRWDNGPAGTDEGAIPIEPDSWIRLEDGIDVRFDPGVYRRGDYWWVVARQDLGGIEWPDEAGHPVALPPVGVERRTAVLASLTIDGTGTVVRDLRSRFSPLAPAWEPGAPAPIVAPEPAVAQPQHVPVPSPPPPPSPSPVGPDPVVPFSPGGMVAIGCGDAVPPGYRATGIAVLTRPGWHATRVLDGTAGRPLAIVGSDQGPLLVTTRGAWTLDLAAGRAEQLGAFALPRSDFAVAATADLLLVVGGVPEGGKLDGVTLAFDVNDGTWSERRRMPYPVARPAAAWADGTLHCLGGRGRFWGFGVASRAHQIYDPLRDEWATGPELPRGRIGGAAAELSDGIHVVGGIGRWCCGRSPLRAHDVLPKGSSAWVEARPLPAADWRWTSAATYGEALAATGGRDAGASRCVLVFSPAADRWRQLPWLDRGTGALALGALPNGLLAAGGDGSGPSVLQEIATDPGFQILVPDADEGS